MYSIARRLRSYYRLSWAILHRYTLERRYGIQLLSVPPCYFVVNRLSSDSVIIDLGTGADADFSQGLIDDYGLCSYGFDPTRKHHPYLASIVTGTNKRFQYYPYAISGTPGVRTFFESQENISGSFSNDHANIKEDTVIAYEVQAITLDQVIELLGLKRVDLVKMDIEGEEYNVLGSASPEVLKSIDQLIVEFHHHNIDHVTQADNEEIIKKLSNLGFAPYTKDRINYLFFRTNG